MADEENPENLTKLFDEGLSMYNKITNTDEATNSSSVQVNVIN